MRLRRIAICLAIATWCFLNTWVEFAEGQSSYYDRYDPLYVVVIPVLVWEALLSLGLYAAWEFFRQRRFPSLWPNALFLAFCYIPLGIAAVAALRSVPANLVSILHKSWFVPAVIAAAAVPAFFAFARVRDSSRYLRSMFLYSWPVLAVILIRAATGPALKHSRESYQEAPLARPLPSPKPVRVVWIIFDELSQSIAFTHRPAGLKLPNFDRMKSESFYASAASSPASMTALSIPSLTVGEQVTAVTAAAPDRLMLRTASHPESFSWNSVSNIFDQARELGFNSAIVGWFHPYGRLLNRSVTQCDWIAGWLNVGAEEPSTPQSLLQLMRTRAMLQLNALPLVGHLPGIFTGRPARQAKIERFEYLRRRALELASDPSIGLLFVHLPVPHPPAIYNRRNRSMTDAGNVSYLDGVALADQTLGEIRQALARSGLDDRTALIVSADHGWRTYMWQTDQGWTSEDESASHDAGETLSVPFLVKLPGQSLEFDYDQPFATIATHDLVLEILGGRLTDPSAIRSR